MPLHSCLLFSSVLCNRCLKILESGLLARGQNMLFFQFSVRLKGTTFFKSDVTLSAGSSGQEKSILQHTSLVHAPFSSNSQGIYFKTSLTSLHAKSQCNYFIFHGSFTLSTLKARIRITSISSKCSENAWLFEKTSSPVLQTKKKKASCSQRMGCEGLRYLFHFMAVLAVKN